MAFAQRLADAPAVAAQQRLQVGVGEGGAGALVLAPQRRDPVREGDRDGGKAPLQERAERKLMGRVEIRKQQADRDRVGAAMSGSVGVESRDADRVLDDGVGGEVRELLA